MIGTRLNNSKSLFTQCRNHGIAEFLLQSLKTVCRRQWRQRLINIFSQGAFFGTLAGIVILPFSFFHKPVFGLGPFLIPFFFFGLGASAGLLLGLVLPWDPQDAARRIDRVYRLKDRILTALVLLRGDRLTPIQRLQILDAAEQAREIDPAFVVPYRIPRTLIHATGLVFFAFLATAVVLSFQPSRDLPGSLLQPGMVFGEERFLEETINAIDKLAAEHPEEKPLQDLVGQIRKRTKGDRTTALTTRSEVESSIRTALAALQIESVDLSMEELGQALEKAEETSSVGQALRSRNYSQAAEELEQLNSDLFGALSRQEREDVARQTEQAAKKMQERGQKNLRDATEKMSEAMRRENPETLKEGAADLAGELHKQSLRQQIAEQLSGRLSQLEHARTEHAGSGPGPGEQGGGGNDTSKSDTPGSQWGTGAAGDPNTGEETQLDGVRRQQKLTGLLGTEGESEYEKIDSAETYQGQAVKAYQDVDRDYRKVSEAVLEPEPVPLGRRQILRRYFESIHREDNSE